jgi:DNA processing protein
VRIDELTDLREERACGIRADGIWVSGALEPLQRPCVAIVGTRAATAYGRRVARSIARELATAGCCILSGLALGIDAAAHEGALDAERATIGVLGSGHHAFFPQRNRALAERMLACGGAVLSPFPPEHMAKPHQFLQRNAIVAALADAVLVVEAPARSGALNTAGWAAGRIPVLAVPGDVDRAHVAGCHALIRDGATLARNATDVLEALGIICNPAHEPRNAEGRGSVDSDSLAARILALLDEGERDLDSLAGSLAESAPVILSALTVLELEGRVHRDGTRFGRSGIARLLS